MTNLLHNVKNIFTAIPEPINTETLVLNLASETSKVKKFKDEGFKESGYHRGDTNSLKVFFARIASGHMTDIDDCELNKRQQVILQKLMAKEQECIALEAVLKNTEDVNKKSIVANIDQLKADILQIKIDLEQQKIDGGYSKFKHYLFGFLVAVLSIYLLLFYASSIYSSFFRNSESIIATAGGDLAMVLDSIFDVNGIFTPHKSLFVCYLGAFLFFALGMLPHVYAKQKDKNGTAKVIAVVLLAFLIEAGLAYKIDAGIHNLKIMGGIADAGWHWYSSINFYMVLAFGFVAYMVWGQILEAMIAEKEKTNMSRVAKLQIEPILEKIVVQEDALKIVEAEIIANKAKVDSANLELKKLQEDKESGLLTPDELAKNLDDFYLGWRENLVRSQAQPALLDTASKMYEDMKAQTFVQKNLLVA
jgi:hypothetical protein